jgi:hypothetical protein
MSVQLLDCERIPDPVLEGAFTKYRAYFKDGQLPEGVTADGLMRDCSDCNSYGLLGYGYYAAVCHHRNAFLAMEARAYGFTVVVTNPHRELVAS